MICKYHSANIETFQELSMKYFNKLLTNNMFKTMKTEKTIAKRVKQIRESYGLTQYEFGTRCGISHTQVKNIEEGAVKVPHRATLVNIAEHFGTTEDWLVNGSGEMLPEGKLKLSQIEKKGVAVWEVEAFSEVKKRNSLLEVELERAWAMVEFLKANFQKALSEKIGGPEKRNALRQAA